MKEVEILKVIKFTTEKKLSDILDIIKEYHVSHQTGGTNHLAFNIINDDNGYRYIFLAAEDRKKRLEVELVQIQSPGISNIPFTEKDLEFLCNFIQKCLGPDNQAQICLEDKENKQRITLLVTSHGTYPVVTEPVVEKDGKLIKLSDLKKEIENQKNHSVTQSNVFFLSS